LEGSIDQLTVLATSYCPLPLIGNMSAIPIEEDLSLRCLLGPQAFQSLDSRVNFIIAHDRDPFKEGHGGMEAIEIGYTVFPPQSPALVKRDGCGSTTLIRNTPRDRSGSRKKVLTSTSIEPDFMRRSFSSRGIGSTLYFF